MMDAPRTSAAGEGSAREAWLRLVLAPDIGPVLAHRLLRAFGSPAAIFQANRDALGRVPGMGTTRLQRLMEPAALDAARAECARCDAASVKLLTLDHPDYPLLLSTTEYPPLVLWVRGELAPEDRLAVAIVGPRSPSAYALLMAARLATPLARHGLTLVSGMAHGIDAETHRGALEGGGRTLAVLGQGLGTPVYPAQNQPLAERIVAEGRGALISIFPLETEPGPGLFPLRNEVIAGLALGSLVIEAAERSGALITARHALSAGRSVMACPGDATRRAAVGSNRLIADGATLVQDHEDVLGALRDELRRGMAELGVHKTAPSSEDAEAEIATAAAPRGRAGSSKSNRPRVKMEAASPVERAILAQLAAEPQALDSVLAGMAEAGHGTSVVLQHLLQMEIDGRLKQLPGRIYALAE